MNRPRQNDLMFMEPAVTFYKSIGGYKVKFVLYIDFECTMVNLIKKNSRGQVTAQCYALNDSSMLKLLHFGYQPGDNYKIPGAIVIYPTDIDNWIKENVIKGERYA